MTALNYKTADITHEQRKKIFALCKERSISNDVLHDQMYSWADVSSLSSGKCTFYQANRIIEALQKITQNKTAPPYKYVKAGATEKQIHAIKTIQRILGWNDGRLNGFIDHTVEKRAIEDLTVPEASKVIIGLRKMVK